MAAIELNLITAAEITSGSFHVESLNERNRLARVVCGDRRWIAKHAGGPVRAGNDWHAELATYRVASADSDTTIVPRFVAYSQGQELILIDALDDGWRRLDSFELSSPWSIEIYARVATDLARWHQTSRSLTGLDPAEPWLMAQTDRPHCATNSGVDDAVAHVLADDWVHQSIREVQDLWLSSHVIHGDVRLSHVMSHADGPTRLVDWSASGLGDPRWDLAGLLQELYSTEAENGIDTTAHRSAVLDAYAERAQSPSALSESDPALQAFVAARLIWRAIQIHQSPDVDHHRVDAHLAMAKAVRSP